MSHPNSNQFKEREVEPKFFDVTNGTAISWTGTLAHLTPITQGPAGNQRVGDEIDLIGLDLRWMSTAQAGDTLRIVIFQCYVDSPSVAIGSLFQTGDLGAVGAPTARYNYQAQRQEELAIFYDQLLPLGVIASPNDTADRQVKLPISTRIRFDAGTATCVGGLFIALVGQTVGAAATVQYTTRVYFIDP